MPLEVVRRQWLDRGVSSPFVDVATLLSELTGAQPPTLLDVRWSLGGPPGEQVFVEGHLPGAAYVDLDTALADPASDPVDSRGRHPLPDPERFGAAMRAAGVRTGRPVVVYDGANGVAAARCWWLLRHHGHDDVRVLDGGYAAWLRADAPAVVGESLVEPGDFVARPGRLPVLAQDDVGSFAGVLLDARTPERFRGETEPVDPVAGHVPGARNLPTSALVRADGTVRPAAELSAAVGAVGADDGPVAAYCGSGVTAAHTALVLASLGIEVALQPESWSGWVADPARPVATGD